ncbi:hypothetical protein DFH11DRAFT_979472 [Phellopilus nigrolimitatus]|nr:hypothetical protein DFH11DRAFT_979472 [Phellopilus nigrolimitatus]
MAQATDALAKWRHNIFLISQMIQNDVSSTKVRLFLRRGLSVRYLLPTPVIDYIEANGLYLDEGPNNANAQYMQQLLREKGLPGTSAIISIVVVIDPIFKY